MEDGGKQGEKKTGDKRTFIFIFLHLLPKWRERKSFSVATAVSFDIHLVSPEMAKVSFTKKKRAR